MPPIAHTTMLATHRRMTRTVVLTSSVPIRNHGSLAFRRPAPRTRSGRPWDPTVSSNTDGQASPGRHDPGLAGLLPVQGRQGRVIYVGKAASLRQRLSNYFADPRTAPADRQMVAAAESVEWTTVRNEVEALMLEFSLIKEHGPRFNVRLRDDKSYPFLAVTVDEQWPRALVMRGASARAPATSAPTPTPTRSATRSTSCCARFRSARAARPSSASTSGSAALPAVPHREVHGPCVGEIDEMAYRQLVVELCDFLDGDTEPILKRLDAEMREAATELEFEKAAGSATVCRRCAGRSSASRWSPTATRTSTSSGSPRTSWRPRCRSSTSAGAGSSGARDSCSTRWRRYAGRPDRPHPRAAVRRGPSAGRAQAGARAGRAGRPGDLRGVVGHAAWLPGADPGAQRGDKRALLETVTRNAEEEFTRHRLRRASDHNTRSRALTELQEHLGLPEAPLRIECYDMAHLQGTDYVGSMVVLEDGLPNKREYRRFKVHVPGNDDYAAMEEVLTRRLTAYLADRTAAPAGGAGQVLLPAAAAPRRRWQGPARRRERVVRQLGLEHEIPVAGLAKRFEEVYVPGRSDPVRSRGGARRCSCCSASATRPTASPTRSTASGAASG